MTEPIEQESVSEIHQEYYGGEEITPLAVCVDDIVDTRQLPSRIGASHSYTIDTFTAWPVVGADDRRRRLVLISLTKNIFVGEKDRVADGSAAIWPFGVPLVLENTETVYARVSSDTASDTTVISYFAENWAE